MMIGPRDANVLWTLLAGMTIVAMSIRLRKHINWKLVFPMFAGSFLGTPLGVYVVAVAPGDILIKVFGFIILVFALYYFFSPEIHRHKASPLWGIPAGFLGGFLGGLCNMSGPPVVIFLLVLGLEKKELKGTLAAFFLLSVGYKIPFLVFFKGLLSPEHVMTAGLLAIPVLAGMAGGMYAANFFSTKAIRRAICLLLMIPALTLLVP
jgi:hypothetical protein